MKIKLEFPALVLNVVSLVASIVGVVIPYWEYASNSNTVAARGLWHRCDTKNQEALDFDCFAPYPIVPNYLHAVRALELLGMILVVLSIGCGVLRLLFMKERVMLPRIAMVFAMSAGVFMLIGILIFAVNYSDSSDIHTEFHFKLSAGFGLCTGAGILAVAAGFVYLIICCREKFWWNS